MVRRNQVKVFVEGLFTLNATYDRFKLNLRDFLIQLKEFSGDNADLYADEKEQQDRDAKAAERERLSKVGGLLKPAELAEDDDEYVYFRKFPTRTTQTGLNADILSRL